MSRIVYSEKGLALASGLKWPVLNPGAGLFKGRTWAIRQPAQLAEATRYVLTTRADVTRVGLFTPDTMQAPARGKVHSLALVFLEALQSHGTERNLINAMLSIAPATDAERRAVVVIEGGEIVRDQMESRQTAAQIAAERHESAPGLFKVYSATPDIEGATLIQWADLIGYAHKGSATTAIPVSPLVPLAVSALLLAIGGGLAYHYLIALPQKRADAARVLAATDKTAQYVERLEAELGKAGWDIAALSAHLQTMATATLYADGWSLKSLECEVGRECRETWSRVGGLLPDLLKQRPEARYLPAESTGANLVVLSYAAPKEFRALQPAQIPANKVNADLDIKPVMQHLLNAGQDMKVSEFDAWPPGPVAGVQPDVLVQRRKVEITSHYFFTEEALAQLPDSVLGQSFELVAGTPIKVTFKGHQYAK